MIDATLCNINSLSDGRWIVNLLDHSAGCFRTYVYQTEDREEMERALSRIGTFLSLHAKCTEDFINNKDMKQLVKEET